MFDASSYELVQPLTRLNSRYIFFLLFAVVASIWINLKTAEAARLLNSEKATCRYILEGQIEAGDLDQIKGIANEGDLFTPGNAKAESVGDEKATLCLNSPGGSFIEGVALAKFISERGIATVIDEADSCLSACAIIFMAGRTVGAEEDYTNRKLHVNGVLGFHRPYLSLPVSDVHEYSAKDINDSADFIIDAVTFLLSLSNQQGSFDSESRLKPSLVEAMLEAGRDDFLYVDTVDKAGRWEIDVFGYKRPKNVDRAAIYNTCANFIAWRIDQSNSEDYVAAQIRGLDNSALVVRLDGSERPNLQDATDSFRVIPGKSGYASVECIVNVYRNAETEVLTLSVCASDGFTGLSYGNCYSKLEAFDIWVTPLATHSPTTKLTTLGRN